MAPHVLPRTHVFISYSRRDRTWVDRLRVHLKPLERQLGLQIWDDSELAAGSRWQDEIAQKLASTKVAVLFISADFLASDFIEKNELPPLLDAAAHDGVVILPVILSASRYLSIPELAVFNAVNSPSRPLIDLSENEQEAVLDRVSRAIEASFGAVTDDAGSQTPGAPAALRQMRDPVRDFVGRTEEIDEIVAALSRLSASDAAGAIVVVRGMGGVGKTELAYKVATRLEAQFPDGQLLVELGGETPAPLSAEQALRSVIRNFLSPETANKADTLGKLQALYESALAGKHYLIVADNVKGADQIRPLLPTPGCGLLVTTRQRFALPGMIPVDLDSLSTDAAEQLLRQICSRIGDAAARMAQLCGRLPLALRVSASMLASDDSIRVERYLERLADEKQRLSLLHDPDDPALDVGASLRLSYDALEPAAQDVLCQLSVFPASFDLNAALGVVRASDAFDVEQSLSRLRRRSLIDWAEDEQRYSLHDLVRVFASTRSQAIEDVRARHAQYFADLLTSAKHAGEVEPGASEADTGDTSPSESVPDLWELSYSESANIEAGWRWAKDHMGDTAADRLLVSYALALGDTLDAPFDAELMDASLATLRRGERHLEAMAFLRQLGGFYLITDSARALRYYQEGCTIARALHDRLAEGGFLINIGMTHWALKDREQELDSYGQALDLSRETGSRWLEASALANIGSVKGGINRRALYEPEGVSFAVSGSDAVPVVDAHEAIECYEQALSIWRAENFSSAVAATLAHLGMLHDRLDDVAKALQHYELALAGRPDLDSSLQRTVLIAMVDRHSERQEYDKALAYAEQLLEVSRSRHDLRAQFSALTRFGDVNSYLENHQAAFDAHTQALALARELGDVSAETSLLNVLGGIAGRLGTPDRALSYYEQAVAASRTLDNRDWRAELLCNLGKAYDDAGRHDDGITAFQAALAVEPSAALVYTATMGLGGVYLSADRWSDARREYLRSAQLEPSLFGPHLMIGLTYYFQSRYDEALAAFRRARELGADMSEQAEACSWMGHALFLWGRDEEALAAYQQASGLEPGSGAEVGRMYYVLGRLDESLAEYQRAHATNPSDADAALGLARLYRRTGDVARFEEAITASRRVIEDSDDDSQGRLAAIEGRVDEAVMRLEAALASKETTLAWARRDPDFDFIRADPRFQAVVDR